MVNRVHSLLHEVLVDTHHEMNHRLQDAQHISVLLRYVVLRALVCLFLKIRDLFAKQTPVIVLGNAVDHVRDEQLRSVVKVVTQNKQLESTLPFIVDLHHRHRLSSQLTALLHCEQPTTPHLLSADSAAVLHDDLLAIACSPPVPLWPLNPPQPSIIMSGEKPYH